MLTRSIVGVLYAVILIGAVAAGAWTSALLILAMGVLGGLEFYRMAEAGGYRPAKWLGVLWIAALVLTGWQPPIVPLSTILTAGLIGILVYSLFQVDRPLNMWIVTSAGAVYLGLMTSQMLALRMMPNGMWLVFLGFFATWANDTFAYFTGVAIGRHKIWPRLSPKKSWEGTIGGCVAAAVVAFFGDLGISMIKRQVGVKDSGSLLPGHGGVLDRIDSILFVLPFIYQAVLLFGPR
jgi:phosphatidate cytidylyltransferase